MHIDEDYSMYVFDSSADTYFNFSKRENQEVRAHAPFEDRTLDTRKRKERERRRTERTSTAS